VPDVKAVWAHEIGGARMFTVVAITQRYAGHARRACSPDAFSSDLIARRPSRAARLWTTQTSCSLNMGDKAGPISEAPPRVRFLTANCACCDGNVAAA